MQSLCQFILSRSTPSQRIPSKSQTSDKVLANHHLTTDFDQKAVMTQFYSHIKQADVDSPKESCPKTLNKTRKILWQYELCQGSSELVSEIKCLFVRYRSQIPFMKLGAIEGQFPEIDDRKLSEKWSEEKTQLRHAVSLCRRESRRGRRSTEILQKWKAWKKGIPTNGYCHRFIKRCSGGFCKNWA